MKLTVDFTVLGRPFVGLNGGPGLEPNQMRRLLNKSCDELQGFMFGRPCWPQT